MLAAKRGRLVSIANGTLSRIGIALAESSVKVGGRPFASGGGWVLPALCPVAVPRVARCDGCRSLRSMFGAASLILRYS